MRLLRNDELDVKVTDEVREQLRTILEGNAASLDTKSMDNLRKRKLVTKV